MTQKPSPLTSSLYLIHRFKREIVFFIITSLFATLIQHYLFQSFLSTASLRVDPNGGSAISGINKSIQRGFMDSGGGPDYLNYLKLMRSRAFHDYLSKELQTNQNSLRKVKRIYGNDVGSVQNYVDQILRDVDFNGRESDLIDVTVNNESAINAVDLANLVSDLARKYLIQYETAEVDVTIEYLKEEMRKQEETLKGLTSESERLSYHSQSRPLPSGSPVELHLDNMERELSMMKVKVKEISYLINDLNKTLQQNPDLDIDPSLRGHKVDKLRDLLGERKAYDARMKALVVEIEAVKKAYFNPTLEGKASRLQKTVASEQDVLFGLRKKIYEMQFYRVTLETHVRLHSSAVLETVKSKFTLPKKLALAFVLSVLTAILFLLLREQLNPTVFYTLQVSDTGVEPLAAIPDRSSIFQKLKSAQVLQTADFHLRTQRALPFYYMGRKIARFHKQDRPTFVTTIGASPGQKSPVVAANLATALAADGARVCLVDCDSDMPSYKSLFAQSSKAGLNDNLLDDSIDKFAGKATIGLNLDVLGAGRSGSPTSEQLDKCLIKMMEQCRGKYDYVIFDAPDLKRSERGVTLSKRSSLTILISEAEETRLRQWQESVNTLKLHDINNIYGVINGAEDYFLMNSAPMKSQGQDNIHELRRKAKIA